LEIGHLVHRHDVDAELARVAGVHGSGRVEPRQAADWLEVPAEDIDADGEDGWFGRFANGDTDVERPPRDNRPRRLHHQPVGVGVVEKAKQGPDGGEDEERDRGEENDGREPSPFLLHGVRCPALPGC
jgi:hypothetical protein